MLLQSGLKNNQKTGNQLVNDELYEDYLFQYTDSGDHCFNNESFSENHPESYMNHNMHNDMNQYANLQENNFNSKQIQKDEHFEIQKDYNDYYNSFQQHQSFNNHEDDFQIQENYEDNGLQYANFINGQSYIQKNYYQQLNNSFSNNQNNNNNKSQGQFNENVIQIPRNNQKYQQQAFSFNQGFHEELNGVQVKPQLNPLQSNLEQITLPSNQENIRNNKQNQRQKSSQQNLNRFESIQISETNAPAASASNVNNQPIQMKVEQTFEQVIQSSAIPISRNYYQLFQEYQNLVHQQKSSAIDNTQGWQNLESKNEDPLLKSEDDDAISQGSTIANSIHKEQYLEEEEEENMKEQEIKIESENSMSSSELEAKQTLIRNSNKKNVVKNIMSAFKNFILEPKLHNYNLKDLDVVLEMYNLTKKGIDDMSEMQAKFKRYITSKNFNHYTVKLLIQHQNYSSVFKYFLNGPIEEWILASKVSDTKSHKVMIDYLKECFDDIRLIDLLKRHEKKRAHFQ